MSAGSIDDVTGRAVARHSGCWASRSRLDPLRRLRRGRRLSRCRNRPRPSVTAATAASLTPVPDGASPARHRPTGRAADQDRDGLGSDLGRAAAVVPSCPGRHRNRCRRRGGERDRSQSAHRPTRRRISSQAGCRPPATPSRSVVGTRRGRCGLTLNAVRLRPVAGFRSGSRPFRARREMTVMYGAGVSVPLTFERRVRAAQRGATGERLS